MVNVYLSGNTIRFQVTFYDFNNQEVNPQIVKLIIYDSRYNKINEYILSDSNRLETGLYYYDYVTTNNDNDKKFYYEFYGDISGKPSLNRGEFIVKFI